MLFKSNQIDRQISGSNEQVKPIKEETAISKPSKIQEELKC